MSSDCRLTTNSTSQVQPYNQRFRQSQQKRTKYKKKKNTGPINSYGIILYRINNDGGKKQVEFLLYQRRDTFEYSDFLRGIWKDRKSVAALCSLMSDDERNRLLHHSFVELWDDLWVIHGNGIYKDGFNHAQKKWEIIKNDIADIVKSSVTYLKEPPWGFPKGKKNFYREDDIICAIREFSEETRISQESIEIVYNSAYPEHFEGSNGKEYSTYYYVAKYRDDIPATLPEKMQTPDCIRKTSLSEEAAEIAWCNFAEACDKLNPRRKLILSAVRDFIINLGEAKM